MIFLKKDSRVQWDEEKIEKQIKDMVSQTHQTTFPTHSEMKDFFKDYKLSNAVRRHGGTRYWAEKLGMEVKDCESETGYNFEERCVFDILEMCDLQSELCAVKYPYDLIVERCLKIDVKASALFSNYGKSKYFTFNLEKKNQTCDIFVFYCIDDLGGEKVYVIPSYWLSGKSQFAIGTKLSKYDKFLNRWDIITKYVEFMKSCE